ncbi:murein hydrolase regulator LrgA [Moraxella caviae]|uniref:Effector of murein hydrolase LrgA n=1 Tax=Moraxella caviae TaxID=34060 RepID=A0A1S9ZXA2_9GAMM|nr:CidA/LrgA family protein [Moraxella caviae]OOR88080.1 murein hydrolase regulator LrgA [Moraxella caviae]STZ09977.1 Putative effector of murein hydrolase LrgA [Moraxella caviae]
MILKAFLVVFACLFLGEIFIWLTDLPLPPSVIGLLILFALLQTGVVPLATVQQLARTMLDYLVLIIVPVCISLMQYLDIIKSDAWILIVATSLSTLLVLIVTGKVYAVLRAWQKSRHALTNRHKS